MSWAQGENLHYLVTRGGDRFNREPHLHMVDPMICDVAAIPSQDLPCLQGTESQPVKSKNSERNR
jgi:hypothetical protein